jgi:hypothetical protein
MQYQKLKLLKKKGFIGTEKENISPACGYRNPWLLQKAANLSIFKITGKERGNKAKLPKEQYYGYRTRAGN